MKSRIFAQRNLKEIFRDPVSLIFSFGLPVAIIILAGVLNQKIPSGAVNTFSPELFVPAGAVFAFSFITMFTGMLVSKDRTSNFLTRLFASPLKPHDYILGYALPIIPLALLQSVLCFAIGLIFGLKLTVGVIYSIIALLPCAVFFTAFGLLFGSILGDKSIGGVSSVLVQCTALLSGMWFDLELFGKVFEVIMNFLPFANFVEVARLSYAGDLLGALPHFLWSVGYAIITFIFAVFVFKAKSKK